MELKGYTWNRPDLPPETVEILKPVERPNLTAVFGTSVPPSGLSGMIRRAAYKKNESSYGGWLPLVLADRIQVFEGIASDLSKGIIPNTFRERGWSAEWKYNRKGFLIKSAATVAITAGIALSFSLFYRKEKSDSHR